LKQADADQKSARCECPADFTVTPLDGLRIMRSELATAGSELLRALAAGAARSGVMALAGFVLADNWPMLQLLARFDCDFRSESSRPVIRVFKRL
jgi:hypothetical protein